MAELPPNPQEMPDDAGKALLDLLDVMSRLRDPDGGCPWDLVQDFKTIVPYTIEEAYEVADAIERDDADDLRLELGDLLLQVVYHAQMAKERNWFDFAAVAQAITAKMIERHPHVFGAEAGADPGLDAVRQSGAWEQQKRRERERRASSSGNRPGVLDDVPLALPALKRAQKLQSRAARVGFDWPDSSGALAKVREESAEVEEALRHASSAPEAVADEIGDLLFAAVNLARHSNIDAETALQAASRKFERRFSAVEAMLGREGLKPEGVNLDYMENLWRIVKNREKRPT